MNFSNKIIIHVGTRHPDQLTAKLCTISLQPFFASKGEEDKNLA